MGKESVELTLFPGYSAHMSAERNLEEYPLFELKARQRGSSARVFERMVASKGGASLKQPWKVIPSGEYGMPGPVDQDVYLAVLRLLEQRGACRKAESSPSPSTSSGSFSDGQTTRAAPTGRSGTRW